jgi:hypothetical protein
VWYVIIFSSHLNHPHLSVNGHLNSYIGLIFFRIALQLSSSVQSPHPCAVNSILVFIILNRLSFSMLFPILVVYSPRLFGLAQQHFYIISELLSIVLLSLSLTVPFLSRRHPFSNSNYEMLSLIINFLGYETRFTNTSRRLLSSINAVSASISSVVPCITTPIVNFSLIPFSVVFNHLIYFSILSMPIIIIRNALRAYKYIGLCRYTTYIAFSQKIQQLLQSHIREVSVNR